MIYYKISPDCVDPNNQRLYLTAQQSTASVAVMTLLPNDDWSQLWTPVEYILGDDIGVDKGFVLLNRQTNMVISADDRVPVRLTTFQNWKRGTWKFTDTRAIELQENTDMNLNVYVTGKDPQHVPAGAQIYAWNWGNNFNERWKFALIDGA